MSVSLSVRTNDLATRKLKKLSLLGGPTALSAVLDEIGAAGVSSTQQRFLDQRGPDGTDWPGHSESTQRMRGEDANVLRDHNHLFDSLTHQVERNQVRIGSARVYARIHQLGGFGGVGGATPIPARPYLGLSSEDRHELERILDDHLRRAMGGSA